MESTYGNEQRQRPRKRIQFGLYSVWAAILEYNIFSLEDFFPACYAAMPCDMYWKRSAPNGSTSSRISLLGPIASIHSYSARRHSWSSPMTNLTKATSGYYCIAKNTGTIQKCCLNQQERTVVFLPALRQNVTPPTHEQIRRFCFCATSYDALDLTCLQIPSMSFLTSAAVREFSMSSISLISLATFAPPRASWTASSRAL